MQATRYLLKSLQSYPTRIVPNKPSNPENENRKRMMEMEKSYRMSYVQGFIVPLNMDPR